MKSKFSAKVLMYPGRPTLLVNERAQLACGCKCYVGRRFDTKEVATAVVPCGDSHLPLVRHFNLLLKESLTEPEARPLLDVVNEKLEEAERNWKPDANLHGDDQ